MKLVLKFILLSAFFLIAFSFSKPIHAVSPSFGPNILVSDATSLFASSSDGPPIINVDIAGGVYIAWIDHRGSQPGAGQTEVFFSKLSSSGSGFTANKPLTGVNDHKSFPQIEEDGGNIYIAWGELRFDGSVYKQAIFFTKSTDGGANFTEEFSVDSNDGLPISMIAKNGKIFITYSKAANEIWLASSFDGGINFTKTKVSDSTNSQRHRPTVDFLGSSVFVFWLDGRNSDFYEVFFAKSPNDGADFDPNISVFNTPDSAIHLAGNTFGRLSTKAAAPGSVFLAFDFLLQTSNPPTSDREVYFLKSENGGDSFSSAARLSDDDPNSHTLQQGPSLTLLPDGSPAVAWHDFRDGDGKVMLVYWQDQDNAFSPNIKINNTPTNSVFSAPTIASDNEGKIHFVRWDAALSPVGVYYTKIDLGQQFNVPPIPFLDLPWDYEDKDLSFNEAALAINSYFDHEYPLLSTGLIEPSASQNNLTSFRGEMRTNLEYSRHDGYDWGKKSKAEIGNPVLASANGCASYSSSGAGGNIIKINHGNDYQTRYLHLQDDNFLVTKSSVCVEVTQGQRIGSVGYSGNVKPKGEDGAHIHFMVIQDKDKDGNYDDNIPDGLVDPFGWQSQEPDPWPNYSWQVGDQNFSGNTSYYLWTKSIANLSDQLTSNGGFFQLEQYSLEFPQGATGQDLNIQMQSAPVARPSNTLESIGSTITITAKDALGNIVSIFQNFFTITIDFSHFDLTSYEPETIAIYSSEDGINWVKEETTIVEKTATAQLNHLSHFALMAQRKDITPPVTVASLTGEQGQPNWYRSDVQVLLNAQDNEGGLGIDYTLYKIDNGDWQQYPLSPTIIEEGNHKVEFYSVDNDENIEDINSIEFNIDRTPPQATIQATPNLLWPPDGRMVSVVISGSASDNTGNFMIQVQDEYSQIEPLISKFDDVIQLRASRNGEDKDGRTYTVQVLDFAGNYAESYALIVVPHDQK